MFRISNRQKKLRKVRDICAAFHKEDFGERGVDIVVGQVLYIRPIFTHNRVTDLLISEYKSMPYKLIVKSRETFITFRISN